MKTIRTASLKDVPLDYAVGQAKRYFERIWGWSGDPYVEMRSGCLHFVETMDEGADKRFKPSLTWKSGGPIIEEERICLDIGHDGVWLASIKQNYDDNPEHMHTGSTPLEAAMRCYVASKLGDTVEIIDCAKALYGVGV